MDKLLGDGKIHPQTFEAIRQRGGAWAAYQCVALDSSQLGAVQFLKYGPDCTFKAPPEAMPNTPAGIGWKFRHVGFVDLASGQIVATEPVEGGK
jgi:hypothetical protein